jgi:hypothetical protein
MKKALLLAFTFVAGLLTTVAYSHRVPARALPLPSRQVASQAPTTDETGLKIPFFYAVPKSSSIENKAVAIAPDEIIEAVHPDSINPENPLGLRIYKAGSRKDVGQRLVHSGFLQTGDIILTFRPAWGGAGPYADLQMGISHTGMAMALNDRLYNVDNPLSGEYLDPKGNLSSEHYLSTRYLHIVRPRMSEGERDNLTKWASILFQSTFPAPGVKLKRIYQESLEFNQNYGDPRIAKDKQLGFVRDLGRMVYRAKGIAMPSSNQMMFCSEFAWAVFALRGCNPEDREVVAQFAGKDIPSCIKPIFEPLKVTGSMALDHGPNATIGLAEGPLAIIDSMMTGAPAEIATTAKRDALVSAVFPAAREGDLPGSVMSVGHKGVAKAMNEGGLFKGLEMYYRAVSANPEQAKALGERMESAAPANYSPASYLLNTLLPTDNHNRAFDYVGTLDLGSGS